MLPREHLLKQPFRDPAHFPDGFEAGGHFTATQARLLRRHGHLIEALTKNQVSDPTDDDRHLLQVIERHRAPQTPIEVTWLKYLKLTGKHPGTSLARSA